MRPKYLLKTYDKLIQELKNANNFEKESIVQSIKSRTSESYLCYKIHNVKTKKNIQYKVDAPIHNLHPFAPILEQTFQLTTQEWETEKESFRNRLGIPFSDLKYFYPSNKRDKYFYLTADIALETLPTDYLLFIYISITIKKENQLIIKNVKKHTFHLKSTKLVEQFIFKLQTAIESIKQRLIKEINPAKFNEVYKISESISKCDGYKSLFINLDKISRFIEKDYSKFLLPQAYVSYQTINGDEKNIVPKINILLKVLISSKISSDLFKIINKALIKISNPNIDDNVTVSQFHFLSKFITVTYNELLSQNKELTQTQLEDWLLEYNFNATEMIVYFQSKITLHIDDALNDNEKIELINFQIKRFNQLHSKIEHRLHYKLPLIKSKMVQWLQDEKRYLKSKKETVLITPAVSSDKAKNKLQLEFSVAQISYFFGLMMRSGIIKHQNQREVFRFIADNFKTQFRDNISADSINSKFYNIEETTKKAIRTKIIEMLNLTKTILFISTFLEDYIFILE